MNDKIKEVILKLCETNEYMKNIGLEITELEEGYIMGRIPITGKLINPYGSVHGGALYALADISAGFCACTYGSFVSTVSGNLNYLKPAAGTDYVYCSARVLHMGRRVGQVNVSITDDAGTLLDTGNFTFAVMNKSILS